ncbi:MAG: D-lyxose/D-mannose family sugar isomerase [Oscillospiraceae bacterium]|nr:D-lyxose/D-mannose family sugar isomerase [Oscillospiraceae bacterium]
MKRSEINKTLHKLEAMCEKHCCYLPPFCHAKSRKIAFG